MKEMSSRERMLSELNFQKPDYIPCCFMIFWILRHQCRSEFEFLERQIELGIDTRVNIPEFTLNFHPDVSFKDRIDHPKGEKYPLISREYNTPAGTLSTTIKQSDDWPYGETVPLFDDFVAPRATKFLVTEQKDLEKLKYLLYPPTDEDIRIFHEEAKELKKFAAAQDLLVCGGWNSWHEKKDYFIHGDNYGCMGIDALMWLSGPANPIYWAFDQPDFLHELIQMIHEWNKRRMEIYLYEGVDIIIRRGWYEAAEFWSPELFNKFIAPWMKKEIEMTHQAGAKFGYICTSGTTPLINDYIDLGIDVLIGVDPVMGKGTDIKILKEKAAGKLCLWGGVNGFDTVEMGTEKEIETAVENAVNILSNDNGFILSPVDNVSEDTPAVWNNVKCFLNAWKRLR